jgi:hypothetical protein
MSEPEDEGREPRVTKIADGLLVGRDSSAGSQPARRFTAKRRALQAALVILTLGLGAAALLIVLS